MDSQSTQAAPVSSGDGARHSRSGRPKNDPRFLTAGEVQILTRMKRIDRGEGCHATVATLGAAGTSEKVADISKAQARRRIRRLRELGEIFFLGCTPHGTHIYILPGQPYPDQTIIPFCPSRPVDHLKNLPGGESWSTAKAREYLARGGSAPPQPAAATYIDGVRINEQRRQNYSEETLRRAIARMKTQYGASGTPIQNPERLLPTFIELELKAEAARKDAASRVAIERSKSKEGQEAAVAAADDPLAKRVMELLREGRYEEAQALAPIEGTRPETSQPAAHSTPTEPSARPTGPEAAQLDSTTPGPAPNQKPAGSAAPTMPTSGPTVKEIMARLVAQKAGGESAGAASYYGSKAHQIDRILGTIAIADLTQDALAQYKQRRRAERVCDSTVKAELKVLRQALRGAVAAGLVEVGLAARLLPAWRTDPHRFIPRSRGDP